MHTMQRSVKPVSQTSAAPFLTHTYALNRQGSNDDQAHTGRFAPTVSGVAAMYWLYVGLGTVPPLTVLTCTGSRYWHRITVEVVGTGNVFTVSDVTEPRVTTVNALRGDTGEGDTKR